MKNRRQAASPSGLSPAIKVALAIGIAAAVFAGYKVATPNDAASSAPHPQFAGASEVHRSQGVRYTSDTRTYTLPAGAAMEFMYELNGGGAMVYGWQASGQVEYDLHNEPHNDPAGAQTIYKGLDTERHGSYVAPFDGLHGWYWRNNTPGTVTVELTAAGFFRGGRIFHENGTSEPVNLP